MHSCGADWPRVVALNCLQRSVAPPTGLIIVTQPRIARPLHAAAAAASLFSSLSCTCCIPLPIGLPSVKQAPADPVISNYAGAATAAACSCPAAWCHPQHTCISTSCVALRMPSAVCCPAWYQVTSTGSWLHMCKKPATISKWYGA